MFRWIFAHLYQVIGGFYKGEIAAWAEGLEVSLGTATMLNCAYELSHLRWPKLFGCTAGVRWVAGLGMVHLRNLDLPLASMGAASRLFRFHRRTRAFAPACLPLNLYLLSRLSPPAASAPTN